MLAAGRLVLMFTPKLKAVNLSHPDLGGFVPILEQSQITSIDGKSKHHVSKFADAVQELLLERGHAWHHIYQGFCFELPGELYVPLLNSQKVKVSGLLEGGIIVGVMSASLADWVEFLQWALHKDNSKNMNLLGQALLAYFSRLEPFKEFVMKGMVPV